VNRFRFARNDDEVHRITKCSAVERVFNVLVFNVLVTSTLKTYSTSRNYRRDSLSFQRFCPLDCPPLENDQLLKVDERDE
jgi:hypothetical protein